MDNRDDLYGKKIGDSVYWMDSKGNQREGKIIDIEKNVVTAQMKNGHKVKIDIND